MIRERLKQATRLTQEFVSIGRKVIEDELRIRFGETVAESARRSGASAPPPPSATGKRPTPPDITHGGTAPEAPRTESPSHGHAHGHSHSHSHSHSHGRAHEPSQEQARAPEAPRPPTRPPSGGPQRIGLVTPSPVTSGPPRLIGKPLPLRAGAAVRPWIEQTIQTHEIVLFVKGRPGAPACGFSAGVLELFEGLGRPYATVDVLADPEVRDDIKALTQWPTIPQIFVRGEFQGGADIIKAMAASGELKQKLEAPPAELEV